MTRTPLATTGLVATSVLVLISAGWVSMALWFQLPMATAARLLGAVLWSAMATLVVFVMWQRNSGVAVVSYAAALGLVVLWWSSIQPLQHRVWADDVARQFTARVDGGTVTMENVRNFEWRSDSDYTPRWEIRQYDLDTLRSVDVAASYWTGPLIAHTLVSFGFKDGRFLTFSIEIRRERDETFSSVGGFFKKFETVLVAADERDILRVRSNVRGEDVYMYRVQLTRAKMRSLFLAYLDEALALVQTPRFYNTLTANCTTIVYELARSVLPTLPLDYRLLASGYLPEYLHDVGGLAPGYSMEALRSGGRITLRAQAADDQGAMAFSAAIRDGLPGANLARFRPAK